MPSDKKPVDEPHPFTKTLPLSKKKNPAAKDEDDIPLHIQLLSLNDTTETAPLCLGDIKQNLLLLEKAVVLFEHRYSVRVLRTNPNIRTRLTSQILADAFTAYLSREHPARALFLKSLKDVPAHTEAVWPASENAKDTPSVIPEGIIYLGLLLTIWLLDNKEYDQGVQICNKLVNMIHTMNRRTLDHLGARVFFYWARFYEIKGRLEELRPNLLNALRTVTLRRDTESEATLINLLLRNYLHSNLYDQADKLISKTTTPASASNNQAARYMYYLGRIKATQLEYTEAHKCLQQAIRKAPQNTATAGFQQAVYKLSIIVQLLMGEIPDRSLFRLPVLRKSLVPYLHICQAVRIGDLHKFQETLATYGSTFRNDKTYTLILRLRHNVIKTGIRMISLSYSRISMHDICLKLGLDSEEDAEFIVSKAIRDGVLDATLDREKGCMQSKKIADMYSTNEPQNAFHQRIAFCLEHHNESVKAMRFPLNAHRNELDAARAARQREREIVHEISEGADMDEDEDEF